MPQAKPKIREAEFTPPAVPPSNAVATIGPNPFEAFGNAVGGNRPNFPFLKFQRGDFTYGKNGDELPLGTELVALMATLETGFIEWTGGIPGERIMGRIIAGFVPPRVHELPRRDKTTWEYGDDGQPKDPFDLTNELVFVDRREKTKAFTFSTSSKGGLSALGELARAFGAHMRTNPGEVPVIKLDTGSYQHSNRAYGRIKTPKFTVVGWAKEAGYSQVLNSTGTEPAAIGGEDDDLDAPF
jgi:hypothetical protein